MPLFIVLSFHRLKLAENLKIIWINSWKSTQCMFYIRFMYYVGPLKQTTTHLSMFPNKDTPCSRENEGIQERSCDVHDKKECFLVCFVQNIRYVVGTSDVTTISNDRGSILQISCKTLLKKTEYCCIVQMHGSEYMRRFQWFRSDAVIFQLFKVFSSSLQHIQRTYRANIHDQLIENTTIMSVDVILSV